MLEQYKSLTLAERVGRLKAAFARRPIKATGSGKVIDSSATWRDKETTYISLEDFLADALVECEKLGLVPTITFDVPGKNNLAALIISDAAGVEQPFTPWTTVPTVKASGIVEDLQAIGSQIKYTRRYLWTTFLDLVEHDALEDGVFNDEIRAVNGIINPGAETKTEDIPQTAPPKPTCNYRPTPIPEPAPAAEMPLQEPQTAPQYQTVPQSAPVIEQTPEAYYPSSEITAAPEPAPAVPVPEPYYEPAPQPQTQTEQTVSEEDYVRILPTEEIRKCVARYMSFKNSLKDKTKDELIILVLELYGIDPESPKGRATTAALQKKDETVIRRGARDIIINSLGIYNTELANRGI